MPRRRTLTGRTERDFNKKCSRRRRSNQSSAPSRSNNRRTTNIINNGIAGHDNSIGRRTLKQAVRRLQETVAKAVSEIIDIGPIKIENDESEWFDSGEFRHRQEATIEFQLQDPQFADDPGTDATLTEPKCEYSDDQEREEVNSDKSSSR